MQKFLLLMTYIFLALFSSLSVYSQVTFSVENFSKNYEAKIVIVAGDEDKVFKRGEIFVLDEKTKEVIIQIASEELAFDEEEGILKANIVELPYGKQSLIIHQDFNFDGIKDFAIQDGQYSCYHGPSFQVFLKKKNKFEYNEAFTRLAHEYCGMFRVDYEEQKIFTMTKSGCCWHEFSEFIVEDDAPKAILIQEEDMTVYPFCISSITSWKNGKKIQNIETTIDLDSEDTREILSFELAKNGKKVVLFDYDGNLNYILLTVDDLIEFNFPDFEEEYDNSLFALTEDETTLVFKNENAIYEIYEKEDAKKGKSVGILVRFKGEVYDLKGKPDTVKGSLKNINLVISKK